MALASVEWILTFDEIRKPGSTSQCEDSGPRQWIDHHRAVWFFRLLDDGRMQPRELKSLGTQQEDDRVRDRTGGGQFGKKAFLRVFLARDMIEPIDYDDGFPPGVSEPLARTFELLGELRPRAR